MSTNNSIEEFISTISEISKQILDQAMKFTNDITQKYVNAIKTDVINPLCDG